MRPPSVRNQLGCRACVRTVQVAVQGCAHGALDDIYAELQRQEQQFQRKAELLICCGDFEATRNTQDLNAMAVPAKFRKLKDFWQYYNGQKRAPVLTLVIGAPAAVFACW